MDKPKRFKWRNVATLCWQIRFVLARHLEILDIKINRIFMFSFNIIYRLIKINSWKLSFINSYLSFFFSFLNLSISFSFSIQNWKQRVGKFSNSRSFQFIESGINSYHPFQLLRLIKILPFFLSPFQNIFLSISNNYLNKKKEKETIALKLFQD